MCVCVCKAKLTSTRADDDDDRVDKRQATFNVNATNRQHNFSTCARMCVGESVSAVESTIKFTIVLRSNSPTLVACAMHTWIEDSA